MRHPCGTVFLADWFAYYDLGYERWMNRTDEVRRESHSFVLRIWRQEQESLVWRGRVQHAASGQTHYFDDIADLLAFVEAYVGPLTNLSRYPVHLK